MSAQTCDVSNIHDEDTLRKMWQDTDDFGRKKEIRAHMYKMREARLKEFYSSGEVGRDIQRTNSSPGMREQRKAGITTHHADSLADHSFLSLKSKEIRDSESPTREISYKINDKLASDQGWTIKTTDERSPDGKKHTTSRSATTAGSEKVHGGVANYAAKNEQKASVYQDGDDKNYTKSAAASSESHLKQEAHGGDENSKFYSSSTSSKSSSKTVTEHKSSDADIRPVQTQSLVKKTYTSNVPEELKKHPSYVDGATKVFTETKTLPDGSQVTTTRYETTGAKNTTQSSSNTYSASSRHQSSSEQRNTLNEQKSFSSNDTKNSKTIGDEVDNVRIIKYSHPDFDVHTTKSGREEIRSSSQRGEQKTHNEQKFTSSTSQREVRDHSNKRYETTDDVQVSKNVVDKDVGTRKQNVREIIISNQPRNVEHTTTVTKTIVVDDNRRSKVADKKTVSDDFINVERQFVGATTPEKRPVREPSPSKAPAGKPTTVDQPQPKPTPVKEKDVPKYEQPERRQPCQPPKSEMDTSKKPTEGQYDTTYRSEFTNKRISVDINPTHDAFVRSLRSVTPERDRPSSRYSPTRTSKTNLRNSQSPEKRRYSPDRSSPTRRITTRTTTTRRSPDTTTVRKAKSPDKYTETITRTTTSRKYSPEPRRSPDSYSTIRRNTYNTETTTRNQSNTDTISRRNKKTTVEDNTKIIDSSTLTRRKKTKPRSRSSSPTDTVSDFEYKTTRNEIVTDLDVDDTITVTLSKDTNEILDAKRVITRKTDDEKRPTSLEFTTMTQRTKKVTDRSPTSPVRRHSPSPTKESPIRHSPSPKQVPRRSSLKVTRTEPMSPSESPPKYFTVSPNEDYKPFVPKDKERHSKPKHKLLKRSDTYEERCRQILGIPEKKKVEKNISDILFNDRNRSNSPEKKSPVREAPRKASLPDEARRPSRKLSEEPRIKEYPSQIRKSPERASVKPKTTHDDVLDDNVPGYMRQLDRSLREKSPHLEDVLKLEHITTKMVTSHEEDIKTTANKETHKIQEFPSQIRKSPERQVLEPYPEKKRPVKDAPKIQEFPGQTRVSPERKIHPDYPEIQSRRSPEKDCVKIQEFPSQIRKSPERAPLEKYPEKYVPHKEAPTISEFPSQIRKSPEREALQKYPEKHVPLKEAPTISEFPSQIRKSPERETLEKYPEKYVPLKEAPTISEFPSQSRKSPERVYPEQYVPRSTRDEPIIHEFTSHQRHTTSPVDDGPKIQVFPSQIRRDSPERQPSQKTSPAQVHEVQSPKKVQPSFEAPQIHEFPSQKRKTPAKTAVEDKLIEQTTKYIEGKRVPVDEPLFTKKFMYELGSDEEDEVITTTNVTVEKSSRKSPTRKYSPDRETVRKDISDDVEEITHKTVKKDLSAETTMQINNFIEYERNNTEKLTKEKPRSKSPVKRPGLIETVETTTTTTKLTKKPVQDENVHQTRTSRVDETHTVRVPLKTSQPKIKPKSNEAPLVKKPSVKELPSAKVTDRSTPERTPKPDEKKLIQKRPNRIPSPDHEESKICCRKETTVEKRTVEPKRKIVSTTISLTPKNSSGNLLPKTPTKATPKTVSTTKVFPVGDRSSPARRVPQKTSDVDTKTVIRVTSSPKIAPVKQLSNKKLTTVTTTKTVKIGAVSKTQVAKPFQNGRPESGEDSDDTKVTENQRVKVTTTTRRPLPVTTKMDKAKPKLEKKCLSTKSIIINSTVADQREIIVDLQRSKSSREETPDRVYPRPVTEEDSGIPRYPDQILEPDEPSRKPKRIIDIPLTESEDVSDFSRFTDISEGYNVVDTDECLLSVNEKVSKFLTTADKLTKKPKNVGPAPKVDRPVLIIDENIESDECLLSVSDKVNKFITTAEKLTINELPDRPKSPRCQNVIDTDFDFDDETVLSVSEKASHFVNTPEDKLQGVAPKVKRPDLSNVDETLKSDECLLSVSDKVTKFVTTAEKLTKTEKVRKEQNDFLVRENEALRREKSPKKDTPKREKSPTKQTPDCPTIESEDDMYKTPKRSTDIIRTAKRVEETITRRDSQKFEPDSTPKSSKRPQPETKVFLGCVGRLRSTESVRKAKAMFESIEKEEKPKQRDILSRPSVFEGRKKTNDVKLTDIGVATELNIVKKKLDYEVKTKSIPEIIVPKSPVDEDDVPGYMRNLDRSLRDKSPHLEDVLKLEQITTKTLNSQPSEEELKITKFGVVLKRTDSENKFERRRSSVTVTADIDGVKKELEIEEIWDLQILEQMLEKVTQYEVRRRIRSQIRIVKKIISENKLEQTIASKKFTKSASPAKHIPKTITREKSPEKVHKVVDRRGKSPEKHLTEYQTKYTKKNSFDSNKAVDNKLYRHTDLLTNKDTTEKVTEYQTSYSRRSSEMSSRSSPLRDSPSRKSSLRESPVRSSPSRDAPRTRSPENKSRTTTTTTTTTKTSSGDLKRTNLFTKTSDDDKPSWVTQRTLRKVTERATPVSTKKMTATTTTVTKKSNLRSSPPKDLKPTDVITSSYGVGPTDEYGSPLFGLKALRAQNKMEKSKVQGTVMHSQFYSENGNEPIGEISVTKYSTDPADLGSTEDLTQKNGLLSKTTTQKFGYKDTPTYKSITDKKMVRDRDNETRTSSTSTSKITRRGSVKEMSQKFIDNAVVTLKSERQSASYPKAGLILRTSSFKDSNSESSREGSPTGTQEMHKTVTVRTSTSTSGGRKDDTFLTNSSRVSGVQDVISRMKTEDYREGESAEDAEARSLLNKFLGSQVLLAGMEGHMMGRPNSAGGGNALNTTTSSSSTSSVRRSTKVTSTVTEDGKPQSSTRVFTHPITQETLDTIWDEYTLRLLLENSQEYEERRIIRLRLKQVMAEKEACAEFVEKTLEETQSGNIQEKIETTKKTFSEGPMTKTQVTTRVTSQQISKKPMSPFAKFRQLDKQNSLNTPPSTPKTPTSGGPMFKFTDPNLSRSASTIKERLLQWCQMKTKEYENIQLDNFSGSWADGLAFCALIHHFIPDAFDYTKLTPKNRRYNFTLAFQTADEKADIAPLLDVDDMVACRKPDWKCVFTYVQSIYRHYKDTD